MQCHLHLSCAVFVTDFHADWMMVTAVDRSSTAIYYNSDLHRHFCHVILCYSVLPCARISYHFLSHGELYLQLGAGV